MRRRWIESRGRRNDARAGEGNQQRIRAGGIRNRERTSDGSGDGRRKLDLDRAALPGIERATGKRAGSAAELDLEIARGDDAAQGHGTGAVVGDLQSFRGTGCAYALRCEGQLSGGDRQISLRSATYTYQLRAVIAGIGDRYRSADLTYKRGIERDAERAGATGCERGSAGIVYDCIVAAGGNCAEGKSAATGVGNRNGLAGAGPASHRLKSESGLAQRDRVGRTAGSGGGKSQFDRSAVRSIISNNDGAVVGSRCRLHLDANRAELGVVDRRGQARSGIDDVVIAGRDGCDVDWIGRIVGDLKGLGSTERADRHGAETEAGWCGGHRRFAGSGEADKGQQILTVVVDAGRARNRPHDSRSKRNVCRAGTAGGDTSAAVVGLGEVTAHHDYDGLSRRAAIRDRYRLGGARRVDELFRREFYCRGRNRDLRQRVQAGRPDQSREQERSVKLFNEGRHRNFRSGSGGAHRFTPGDSALINEVTSRKFSGVLRGNFGEGKAVRELTPQNRSNSN